MVCHIKILLYIQCLITLSLALPVSQENKHEKRSLPVSDPANLVEGSDRENSTSTSDPLILTEKPQNKSIVIDNKTENPLAALNARFGDVGSDEFKIEALDLTKPFKEEFSKTPEGRIGLPFYGSETHIIKVPEPYIVRVPHVIILREHHFINGDHFGGASFPGSFYPFGEFPGITQGFPSSENVFDISQIYPSNPIEISQGFEGFQPINGAGEIQGFPGFGEISQGFEILQPEPIPTLETTDQKVDHETDSVIIDALGNLQKDTKSLKEEKSYRRKNNESVVTEPTRQQS